MKKKPMTKLIAIATACAVAIVISGCEKQQPSEQPKPEKAQAAATTPALDQTDPLVVAKAWWKAATEKDAEKLLSLTAEEAREIMKKELIPHFDKISAYKGKPIDVTGDGKTPNAPAKITEKDGKKYAEVCVVLGGIGTKEENGQDSRLVLKDGKWFVTSKH